MQKEAEEEAEAEVFLQGGELISLHPFVNQVQKLITVAKHIIQVKNTVTGEVIIPKAIITILMNPKTICIFGCF